MEKYQQKTTNIHALKTKNKSSFFFQVKGTNNGSIQYNKQVTLKSKEN